MDGIMIYSERFYKAVFDSWEDWPPNMPFPIIPGSFDDRPLIEEDDGIHPLN